MTVFLDSSVIIAASLSSRGASRLILGKAAENDCELIASSYVIDEVTRNLKEFSGEAIVNWAAFRDSIEIVQDILAIEKIVVFAPAKDRPVLFSAYSYADVLLTLDAGDFIDLLGNKFYGLEILKPGAFLARERALGRFLT